MTSNPAIPTTAPRSISGQQPGMLDPNQPQRLLHVSTLRLSFASFNPRAASSSADIPDLRKLSLHDQLNIAKRVVIETTPHGESFWRFVPRARRDDGVLDEGVWPRVVSICGELVEVSLDQWDIYKLDPYYECRVRAVPQLTTIDLAVATAPSSPSPPRKRPQAAPPTPPRSNTPAQQHATLNETLFASSDEEDEVEDMIIDDPPLLRPRAQSAAAAAPSIGTPRANRVRGEIQKSRDARRAKLTRRFEKLNKPHFDFAEHLPAHQPTLQEQKRNLANVNGCFRSPPDLHYTERIDDEERNAFTWTTAGNTKRNRTLSPAQTRKKLDAKKAARERLKRQRYEEDMHRRREARENEFLRDVFVDTPQASGSTPHYSYREDPQTVHEEYEGEDDDDEEIMEEDAPDIRHETEDRFQTEEPSNQEREASIAESRRKLADLERDRPLWEEAARTRQARDEAEEEALRAAAEERRRTRVRREAEERLRRAREQEEEARVREEEARQEREAAYRRARSRRQRLDRWATAQWTPTHALAHYRDLCEAFDNSRFAADDPLTFDAVPWPILKSPADMSVEDVDWASVEKFFAAVKPMMRTTEYKTFVEKSHRRFHPDRWRSRGVLKNVLDEGERGCMEVAANTVAQALTPMWRDLTGR